MYMHIDLTVITAESYERLSYFRCDNQRRCNWQCRVTVVHVAVHPVELILRMRERAGLIGRAGGFTRSGNLDFQLSSIGSTPLIPFQLFGTNTFTP